MPTIRFRGREIDCEEGEILRDALLGAGESPHNGASRHLNCRGHATCGTCAVEIRGAGEGESEGSEARDPTAGGAVSEQTGAERRRLSMPPHDPDAGLRLACQTEAFDDVEVRKHGGFWGQNVER